MLFWWLGCSLGCRDLRATLCLRVCSCWFVSDWLCMVDLLYCVCGCFELLLIGWE